MSITYELREYADGCFAGPRSAILAIADRIDAEHERLMQEQPFTIDMVPMTDENMAEHGWVKLPKDADGEYIHAGDEMEWLNGLKRGRVTAIGVGEREGWVWVLMDGKNVSIGNLASDLHHYKQPTVEDVLREMADRVYADEDEPRDRDAIVAEYAAKLRLAGDGDE